MLVSRSVKPNECLTYSAYPCLRTSSACRFHRLAACIYFDEKDSSSRPVANPLYRRESRTICVYIVREVRKVSVSFRLFARAHEKAGRDVVVSGFSSCNDSDELNAPDIMQPQPSTLLLQFVVQSTLLHSVSRCFRQHDISDSPTVSYLPQMQSVVSNDLGILALVQLRVP